MTNILNGFDTSTMFDSGADISVFPQNFQTSQKTSYHTTISGFGGGKIRAAVC